MIVFRNKILLTLAISIFALIPFYGLQAEGGDYVDLGMQQSGISFSESQFIAGDEVRIYAMVHNYGDIDVSGYVSFSMAGTPIGDSQVISVRAGGNDEEVYVDFIVPYSDFNILAEIKGTDPADENLANNGVITSMYTPLFDDDGDGVANDDDNCPEDANADQDDADNDGLGDICDEDDDNDTITDEVEEEIGTDPTDEDSDNDGVPDAEDYYPNDPTQSEPPVIPTIEDVESSEPEETPVVDLPTTPTVDTVPADDSQNEDVTTDQDEVTGDVEDTSDSPSRGSFALSPKAYFTAEKVDWNTYHFEAIEIGSNNFLWNFGDGMASRGQTAIHSYSKYGDYTVTLIVVGDNEADQSTDSIEISIGFWHLGNPILLALVILWLVVVTFVMLILRHKIRV